VPQISKIANIYVYKRVIVLIINSKMYFDDCFALLITNRTISINDFFASLTERQMSTGHTRINRRCIHTFSTQILSNQALNRIENIALIRKHRHTKSVQIILINFVQTLSIDTFIAHSMQQQIKIFFIPHCVQINNPINDILCCPKKNICCVSNSLHSFAILCIFYSFQCL